MKRFILLFVAGGLFLLNHQSVSAQQLIVNGGFETGDFTGWTLVNTPDFTSVQNNASLAHSGNDYVSTGPVGAPTNRGIAQSVADTNGAQYTLTYWTFNQSP